jgi:hypothetical protein
MTLNLNSAPYYDDFDPADNYLKILFLPGRTIQPRELTQLQTTIQEQIKKHGDFNFQNGAMIVPGYINFSNRVTYVKLNELVSGVSVNSVIDALSGKIVVGSTTGVKALVLFSEKSTLTDSAALFVQYVSGGLDPLDTSILYSEFKPGEVLTLENSSNSVIVSDDVTYTGTGSFAEIAEGIYYVNGYFVQVAAQTISLDKFGTTPSYQIGLQLKESIVTAEEDSTLYNNASGFYNTTAQGADRLKIELILEKKSYFDTAVTNEFIPLMFVKDGELQSKVSTTKLNATGKILADRTYSESGNYTVIPFKFAPVRHRSNNRGEWQPNTPYVVGDVINYTIDSKTYYLTALNTLSSGYLTPNVTYGEFNDGGIRWLVVDAPRYNGGLYDAIGTLDAHVRDYNTGDIRVTKGKAYIKGNEIDISTGFRNVEFNLEPVFTNASYNSITPISGQYFYINDIKGLPSLANIDSVNKMYSTFDIMDNNLSITGSCRIRSFEYDSGTLGAADCLARLYIFDVVMDADKPFAQYAQKIKSQSNGSFSANIVGTQNALSGSVSNGAGSGTITGNGTLFSLELSVGDSIVIKGSTVSSHKVTNIASAISMTVVPAVVGANSNVICYKESSAISGVNSLIQPLPDSFVKTIRNDLGDVKTSYHVKRMYQARAINDTITLNVSSQNELFSSTSPDLHLVSLEDGTVGPINGLTITISGTNNSQLQIYKAGLGNSTYRVLTTIKKLSLSAKEKVKTRKFKTIVLNTLNDADIPKIPLTEADVVRVVSVTQSGSNYFDYTKRSEFKEYVDLDEIDITLYYTIESTSNNTYYNVSYVQPTSNWSPTAPIKITYEYYDHGPGDYFSVDSYDVPYSMIPKNGMNSFADFLDFRSRISDGGLSFDTADGASISEPLSSIHPIELFYSIYLPRRDVIEITSDGSFRIEQGQPSLNPVAPIANDGSTILGIMQIPAYVFNISDVTITNVNIKRYTMKDIESIKNRLDNVESAASLSMLESSAYLEQIQDGFGLTRFKNGFIVDQFKDHSTGNVGDPDYKCSIDSTRQECRPMYVANDIKLIETDNHLRNLNGYTVTGDLVTLPYTETILFQNINASTPENITPLTHISSSVGSLNIFPAADTWIDEITIPSIEVRSQGSFASTELVATQLGVLGTVWNAWQEVARTTVATETTINRSASNSSVSFDSTTGAEISATTTITTRTDTVVTIVDGTDEVTRERTGINTFVQEQWDELGRVDGLSTQNWVPFIRQKAIVMYGKNFMPRVPLYAYINQFNVTDYVVPASTLEFTSKTGTFLDYKFSNIDQTDLSTRQYGANSYDILEKGEIIYGATSGASAITIAEELVDGTSYLRILNVKNGPFVDGETVRGKTSGAFGVINGTNEEGEMATSVDGSFFGLLMLPNNDTIKIAAQIINIQLRNTLMGEQEITSAIALYDAHGIANQKQTTILSVRNINILRRGVLDTTIVNENWQTSSSVSTNTVVGNTRTVVNCNCACDCGGGGGGGGDPLAQSFAHTDSGGVFITKVDLYFYALSQLDTAPIFLEIREVVNGYPGPSVVPFSNVTVPPSFVANKVSTTSLIPTTFTFESPVFLSDNTEYCLVIGSNFDAFAETKVWTSKLTEVNIRGQVITSQPLLGSMFKSQNGSSWNAEQLSDVCMTVYKAQFNTSKQGHLKFKNNPIASENMMIDPFKVINGTTLVRVLHNNHGLVAGDKVTFSGAIAPVTALNAQYTVANATINAFTVTLGGNATFTGWVGGNNVKITTNKRFDTLYLAGEDQVLPGSHINYTVRGTNASRVKPALDYPIQIKQNYVMDAPHYIMSPENETLYSTGDSVEVDAYLYSNNPNISPVIDLNTFSLHAISNLINNETEADNKSVDANTLVNNDDLAGNAVFNNAGYFTITDPLYLDAVNTIKVGQYVKFTGTASNNSAMLVTRKETDITTYCTIYTSSPVVNETASGLVTLVIYDFFVDSIAPSATSNSANYISRIFETERVSSGIRLFFDYVKPTEASLRVFYKVNLKSEMQSIETKPWTELTGLSFINSSNSNSYIEQKIDKELGSFNEITIKIEMRTTNTSRVPKLKNMRLITLV